MNIRLCCCCVLSSPFFLVLRAYTTEPREPKVADLPTFLNQVLERFPLISDLSMMRNPACPGLMDIKRPDMEACRMYRTYVVFRAPQLVTVDGVDVTEEVGKGDRWIPVSS